MDFRDTPVEARFRSDVRSFIRAHLPVELTSDEYQAALRLEGGPQPGLRAAEDAWRRAVVDRGWVAPHWPREYGGAGMSVMEQVIYAEEMAEAKAPAVGSYHGIQMLGPILQLFGTDEQKHQHLPRITDCSVTWCQGYSEPGSGSDLASVQLRAAAEGDHFVLDGQKIWTSGAHGADWIFLLARTDTSAPKHRGISMLIADVRLAGISIRPLLSMSGAHGFNEVFFEHVRVSRSALVGELNRGWYVGATLLDFERSNIRAAVELRHATEQLVTLAREAKAKGAIPRREAIADRFVESEVARLLSYRIASLQSRGQLPNYEASVNKLFTSEVEQRIAGLRMGVQGLHGQLRHTAWNAADQYMQAVSATIAAGTSEIQRNIIATRGLGLPRA